MFSRTLFSFVAVSLTSSRTENRNVSLANSLVEQRVQGEDGLYLMAGLV